MYLTLHLTGKIKVDIRRLVAVKSEERLKGDVMPVVIEFCPATRAGRIRQVKAGADVGRHVKIAVLAVRAPVVRTERVDLRDSSQRRHHGGTDRAARADEIPLLFAVIDQLLRDHVQHGKAVFYDGG